MLSVIKLKIVSYVCIFVLPARPSVGLMDIMARYCGFFWWSTKQRLEKWLLMSSKISTCVEKYICLKIYFSIHILFHKTWLDEMLNIHTHNFILFIWRRSLQSGDFSSKQPLTTYNYHSNWKTLRCYQIQFSPFAKT